MMPEGSRFYGARFACADIEKPGWADAIPLFVRCLLCAVLAEAVCVCSMHICGSVIIMIMRTIDGLTILRDTDWLLICLIQPILELIRLPAMLSLSLRYAHHSEKSPAVENNSESECVRFVKCFTLFTLIIAHRWLNGEVPLKRMFLVRTARVIAHSSNEFDLTDFDAGMDMENIFYL